MCPLKVHAYLKLKLSGSSSFMKKIFGFVCYNVFLDDYKS